MVDVKWLGELDYLCALEQQKALVAVGMEGESLHDTLLLLEHPPTYTMGKRGKMKHLLLPEPVLRQKGFSFYQVDRGGDITYHGPGQLVGYPIMNLKRLYRSRGIDELDLHLYVCEIEEVLILTLAELGICGRRYEGYTGVWVDGDAGPAKIAAIGIRVNSRGMSSHGFALNVEPDLDHFKNIVPCGIQAHGVSSIAGLLRRPVTVQDVLPLICRAFSRVFQVGLIPPDLQDRH